MTATAKDVRRIAGPHTLEGWATMVSGLDHLLNGELGDLVPIPTGALARDLRRVRDDLAAELDALHHLREWHEQVRWVNGSTPADHPLREVSLRLSHWLAVLHARGWPLKRLDKLMGTKPGVARARLWRHGHLQAPASVPAYKGVQVDPAARAPRPILDISGERHGQLTAIAATGERSQLGALWVLRCDCGNERVEGAGQFRAGRITACRPCAMARRAESIRQAATRRRAAAS